MPGRKSKNKELTEVDLYVLQLPQSQQEIVQKLREFIFKRYPELLEAFKWKSPVYSLNGRSYLLGIQVFKRHVNLIFFQGTKLYDPNGLLKGSGKLVRHIMFRTIDDIKLSKIQVLIDQTLAIEQVAKAREKKS